MDLSAWAQSVEASALAGLMRGGFWYPIANVLHLFAMALVVVPMLLLDFRLLGAGQVFPLKPTANVLTRCAVLGAVLAVASGVTMFASDAAAMVGNPAMRIKLALLSIALLNAIVLHLAWRRRIFGEELPQLSRLPAAARAQLLLSIGMWLSIPVAGRWIAYV